MIATDAAAAAPSRVHGSAVPQHLLPARARNARRVATAVLPFIVIAALATVLLRGPISGDAMMSYDLYVYFFPAKHLIRQAFLRGEWPLWNPDIFFGRSEEHTSELQSH